MDHSSSNQIERIHFVVEWRTIREMIRDEALYNRESVHITLQAVILIDSNDDYQKKLDTARYVEVFRKKRHELA
jgi:hypothetical protein